MALWAAIHIDLAVGTDGKERVKAPCGGDVLGMIHDLSFRRNLF